MSPELKKQLAFEEAKKHMVGDKAAKQKVVVVMPFQAAWVDPTDEGMEAINDFAADRKGSVYTFEVAKLAELSEAHEAHELEEAKKIVKNKKK